MERYIAFLRGINVSGQKIIKMETLRKVLDENGYSDVKTYIQSGNVLFSSQIQDTNLLILKIENLIEKSFGFHVEAVLRRYTEIESLVNSTFFNQIRTDGDKKFYITFLRNEYLQPISLPMYSKNRDVEIIHQDKMNLFSISMIYKGNYGFPNSFIEKLTRIPATTRNPNTLEKILKLGL